MPRTIQNTEIPNEVMSEKDIPDTKAVEQTKQPAESGSNIDEYAYMLQNLKEQVKYEIKEEIVNSITLKSNSLMSVDPSTATALAAVASSIGGAISQVQPIEMGQPQENTEEQPANGQADGKPVAAQPLPPQQAPQIGEEPDQSQKTAEDVKDFIFDATMEYLKAQNYFELNKKASEEITDDLTDTVGYIDYGATIYATNNGIDFTDANTWDLLEELISDGTLYNTGYNEINN